MNQDVSTALRTKVIALHNPLGGIKQVKKKFESKGMHINRYTEDLLEDLCYLVDDASNVVELVYLSARDLGFTTDVSITSICERVVEQGFGLCSIEEALQFRLQYDDQPYGETVIIGVKPIISGNLTFFLVAGHDCDEVWLSVVLESYLLQCEPDRLLVFTRGKN